MNLEGIELLSDNILIRELPHENSIGSLWLPEDRNIKGIRRGVVVAIGSGDRKLLRECECGHWVAGRKSHCGVCGDEMSGAFLHQWEFAPDCLVGDEVIYWRFNEIESNGAVYHVVHEEQAVLAIIPNGAAMPLNSETPAVVPDGGPKVREHIVEKDGTRRPRTD